MSLKPFKRTSLADKIEQRAEKEAQERKKQEKKRIVKKAKVIKSIKGRDIKRSNKK